MTYKITLECTNCNITDVGRCPYLKHKSNPYNDGLVESVWCAVDGHSNGHVSVSDLMDACPLKIVEPVGHVYRIRMPWPPTVNHYWVRGRGGRVFLGKEGVAYRKATQWLVVEQLKRAPKLEGRLSISTYEYPPDNKVRDSDNIKKALFDALKHAGMYVDDSQLKIQHVEFFDPDPAKKGYVDVEIHAVSPPSHPCEGGDTVHGGAD